jgi:hypothetical protein
VVETVDRERDDAVWERRAGWGGIAFAVFSLAWGLVILGSDLGGFDSSDEELRASLDPETGDAGRLWPASIFLALAGAGLLWFLGSLRLLLMRADPTTRLTAVAFAAGVVLVTLVFVKNAIQLGLAVAIGWEDVEVDPDAYRLLDATLFGLIMHEGVAGAVLVGAASVIVLRSGVLPRWLGWAGAVVAVLAFFSLLLWGLGLLALLAWVAAVSVFVLRGSRAA